MILLLGRKYESNFVLRAQEIICAAGLRWYTVILFSCRYETVICLACLTACDLFKLWLQVYNPLCWRGESLTRLLANRDTHTHTSQAQALTSKASYGTVVHIIRLLSIPQRHTVTYTNVCLKDNFPFKPKDKKEIQDYCCEVLLSCTTRKCELFVPGWEAAPVSSAGPYPLGQIQTQCASVWSRHSKMQQYPRATSHPRHRLDTPGETCREEESETVTTRGREHGGKENTQ